MLNKQFFLVLLGANLLLGCGDSSPRSSNFGGADGLSVAKIIEDIADASGNTKKLKNLIVVGGDINYISSNAIEIEIIDKPIIDGNTAKCMVKVMKPGGTLIGQFLWALEKEGADWKLKDAPAK